MNGMARLTLLAGMLFLSIHANAQTPIFGGIGTPAWSRVHKYFETRFGTVANDEVVLILPTATNAAWDDPNGVLRLMEMYKWGDWMPSHAWQYAPNASKRVSEGYGYFLNSAFVAAVDANGTASPELKNAMKRTNEAVTYMRALYNEKQKEADDAYEEYSKSTGYWQRKSKVDYFKDQGWDTEIDARKSSLDAAREQLRIVTKGIVEPDIDLLTNAKIRFDNPKQRNLLPPVREVLNDRERWQSYYASYIDKDIFDFLNADVPQAQSINESSSKSEFFEQRWQASVSVSFLGLFRAGGASAEQVKREQHIRNNATKIDVSFGNIDTFNIVRGEWFDENVVARFASKLKGESFTAVWGPGGQLELIPKTLLVGRDMAFAIYADSMSLDYLYEHFSGGADAGIFIGWWRIGGGAGYSSTRENTEVQRYSDRIVFRDLSGRGKVLGVLAKHYASRLPKPTVVDSGTSTQKAEAKRDIEKLWGEPAAPLRVKNISQKVLNLVAPIH